ncbi:hypothetical protein MBLNU459_g1400t1 [Dothideomycetes sp. NU459]
MASMRVLVPGSIKNMFSQNTEPRRYQRLAYIIGGIALVVVIFIGLPLGRQHVRSQHNPMALDVAPPAYLHLLAPEPAPNTDLCKMALSAAILGYPEPYLTSWNSYDHSKNHEGNEHLKKITSVQKWLNRLTPARDEDLILIVDADDTWFQLRPQVLLDRYFSANRQANQRIHDDFGDDDKVHGVRQSILFASQRHCFPWTAEDPACYAVPPSTLPSDVYGAETDANAGDEKDPYAKHRARYLSSGFILGPAAAMRKLYNEAAKRATEEADLKSDQQIFGQLFGEQSIRRELLRQQSQSSTRSIFSWFSSPFSTAVPHSDITKFQSTPDFALTAMGFQDWGIGLDYSSSVGFNTMYASGDVEWLQHTNGTQKALANQARGIAKSRIDSLSTDVVASLPPFWTFSTEPVPRRTPWENVTLLTDVWTGVTPALIRHDPRRGGATTAASAADSRQESWWGQVWFQKHARKLYDAHIYAPLGAVAVAGEDGRRQWWGLDDWKGGVRNSSYRWVRFEEICTGLENELFRDGKGPWRLPLNH